jgi:hypothetical protein
MILPAPMLAPETLRPPFTDPAWLYEIKFDGYRCLAGIDGGRSARDGRLRVFPRWALSRKDIYAAAEQTWVCNP